MSLTLGNLVLGSKCHVKGILNVTPDSFYDGGLHFDLADTQKRVDAMVKEGVEIIDIGGESTRPGSKPVTIDEELDRVIPAIKYIAENYDIPISIDTQKSEVAKKAVEAGAHGTLEYTIKEGENKDKLADEKIIKSICAQN